MECEGFGFNLVLKFDIFTIVVLIWHVPTRQLNENKLFKSSTDMDIPDHSIGSALLNLKQSKKSDLTQLHPS